MIQAFLAAGLSMLSAWSALGQLAGQPTFEVATVRLNSNESLGDEGRPREQVNTSPGSLNMRNVSLSSCIRWAYRVSPSQLSGPGWLDSERFDIVAKAGNPAPPDDQLRMMLRALLADRFKLTLHHETKLLPTYVLTVGKNGPKLRESDGEGNSTATPRSIRVSEFKKTSMPELAGFLSQPLGSPAVDETGLTGRFDFTLDFTSFRPTDFKEVKRDEMISAFRYTVISCVQQQLGLKVDLKKRPLEVLVIDHVEKAPAEN